MPGSRPTKSAAGHADSSGANQIFLDPTPPLCQTAPNLFDNLNLATPPYGTIQAFPSGDVNRDGTVNSADTSAIMFSISYEADLDVNMDGSVNSKDSLEVSKLTGRTLGAGQLSDRVNIVGWCGCLYEEAPSLKRGHVAGASPLAHPRGRTLGQPRPRRLRLGDPPRAPIARRGNRL